MRFGPGFCLKPGLNERERTRIDQISMDSSSWKWARTSISTMPSQTYDRLLMLSKTLLHVELLSLTHSQGSSKQFWINDQLPLSKAHHLCSHDTVQTEAQETDTQWKLPKARGKKEQWEGKWNKYLRSLLWRQYGIKTLAWRWTRTAVSIKLCCKQWEKDTEEINRDGLLPLHARCAWFIDTGVVPSEIFQTIPNMQAHSLQHPTHSCQLSVKQARKETDCVR